MREYYSIQLALVVGLLILVISAFFAFRQSPELLEHRESAAVKAAGALPHPVAGMEECHDCHGLKSNLPYPQKHTGWSDQSCTRCHEPPD